MKNYLPCRISVTLCFYFLYWKKIALIFFLNCIRKVINRLSLFRTGKYPESHLLTLSKYKFASKLRPNMEKFRMLGECFVLFWADGNSCLVLRMFKLVVLNCPWTMQIKLVGSIWGIQPTISSSKLACSSTGKFSGHFQIRKDWKLLIAEFIKSHLVLPCSSSLFHF